MLYISKIPTRAQCFSPTVGLLFCKLACGIKMLPNNSRPISHIQERLSKIIIQSNCTGMTFSSNSVSKCESYVTPSYTQASGPSTGQDKQPHLVNKLNKKKFPCALQLNQRSPKPNQPEGAPIYLCHMAETSRWLEINICSPIDKGLSPQGHRFKTSPYQP